MIDTMTLLVHIFLKTNLQEKSLPTFTKTVPISDEVFLLQRYRWLILSNQSNIYYHSHLRILWLDNIITRHELEEASSLCYENWIAIERKDAYIQELQEILKHHNIPYPQE